MLGRKFHDILQYDRILVHRCVPLDLLDQKTALNHKFAAAKQLQTIFTRFRKSNAPHVGRHYYSSPSVGKLKLIFHHKEGLSRFVNIYELQLDLDWPLRICHANMYRHQWV